MPNLNVDIHSRAAERQAERARVTSTAAKLTQFTYVQNTNGVGYRQLGFLFDVTFSSEPVFSYGCQLVSIAASGLLPAGAAIVTHWVQDKAGRYDGVVLVASVTLGDAAGFKYTSRTPTGDATNARVVVAHNLTFAGPALPRAKAETTLAMATLANLTTGIV